MQLTLNLPENFNIYDHMAELKAQGFMLLSFIKQEFGEAKKIKLKTKQIAQKLGVHVSTLRRWVKRLVSLNFVTADNDRAKPESLVRGPIDSALKADPTSCDRDAIRNDGNDNKSSGLTAIQNDSNGTPYTPLAMALLERFKPLAGMAEKRCAAEMNKFSGLKNSYEELKLQGAVGDLKHLQSFR